MSSGAHQPLPCGQPGPSHGHEPGARGEGDDPLVGRMAGSYRITRLLGKGGMGAVYVAEHPSIGSRVAVKVLLPAYAQDGMMASRFFTEARAVNIIRHDNIVQTLDYLYIDGTTPCLVMEFIENGCLLSSLVGRPQPLSVIGPILLQLCDALASAHEHGIVHRDLKPDNVYLTVRDRRKHFVKLMDFGIAKITSTDLGRTVAGAVMGTPSYMSPEQARGSVADIGPASDLYSLGVIMYGLATGRLPFEGSFEAVVAGHLTRDPVPPRRLVPEIPAAYEQIVLKCLAKKPADRYTRARDLGDALLRVMQALSVPSDLPLAEARGIGDDAGPTRMPRRDPDPSRRGQTLQDSAPSHSRLVTALRADHVRLIEMLTSLKGRAEIDGDTRITLEALRDALVAHIKLEDEQLFPVLERHAEEDAKFRSMLALLVRDMGGVSDYAMGFFERCADLGPGDAEQLDGEIEMLSAILMPRMWKEENVLYAEYDKLEGVANPHKLIEELQTGHAFLVDLFEKAHGCGDAKQARAMLFEARDRLIAHIELEDREFHPVLRSRAEQDPRLKSTLMMFARDMEEVSEYALGFFDRCAGDGMDDEDLASECERVSTALMARLWKEENILFPEYRKIARHGRKRSLADELRDEHRSLLELLEGLGTLDIAAPGGREKVLDARQRVLDHLGKEAKTFYPMLKRAAQKDGGLQHTLDLFETDLDGILHEALAAFDRATLPGCQGMDFARAQGALLALLKLRIKREEDVLFSHLPGEPPKGVAPVNSGQEPTSTHARTRVSTAD